MHLFHGLQQELDDFRMKIAADQNLGFGPDKLHIIGRNDPLDINGALRQCHASEIREIRVKASDMGKLIGRTLEFLRNDWTAVASGTPIIQTASTCPSARALSAADPANGRNVAVSEVTPPLPRTCSAVCRVALPTGPTAMRLPLSCAS